MSRGVSDVLRFEELPELDDNHAGGATTAAWEVARRSLDRAAAVPALPALVVVASHNGFYQFIDARTGVFRRFGVFVGDTHSDVGPRCLAVDVSQVVMPRTPHHVDPTANGTPTMVDLLTQIRGLGLFFALSYSSTLCRADIDTGDIIELATFDTRPSAVTADGDFVVAGDGAGDVVLWKSVPNFEQLWKRKRITTAQGDISSIAIVRDVVIAASSADCSVKILRIEDGAMLASLMSEGMSTVTALASTSPFGDDVCTATSRGLVTVWYPKATAQGGPASRPPAHSALHASESEAQWCVRNVATVFPVRSMSFRNGWLVVGGASGQLAVFCARKEAAFASAAAVAEVEAGKMPLVVSYELSSAVITAHVTDDDHLVAVTSSGDVWRWSLRDVLEVPPASDADEVLEGPRDANEVAASAAPRSEPQVVHSNNSDDVSDTDDEEAESGSIDEDDSASNVGDAAAPAAADSTSASLPAAADVIVVDMDVPTPPDGCLTEVSSTRPGTGQRQQPASNNGARTWPPLDTPPPRAAVVAANRKPWLMSELPSSVHNAAPSTVGDRTSRTSMPGDPHAGAGGGAVAVMDESVVPEPEVCVPRPTPSPTRPFVARVGEAEQLVAADRSGAADLRPFSLDTSEIPGLMRGRRMDPRAARAAVDRLGTVGMSTSSLAAAHDDNGTAALLSSLADVVLRAGAPQSRDLVAVDSDDFDKALQLAAVGAVREEDIQNYIDSHKTMMSALAFEHPIRPFMRFSPDEVVFRAVGCTSPLRQKSDEEKLYAATKSKYRDELAPVTTEAAFTRRKDPVYEEQKQVPAPRPEDHLCGDLLHRADGPAIFFDVFNEELEPVRMPLQRFPLPRAPGMH